MRVFVLLLGLALLASLAAACGAEDQGGVVPSPTSTAVGGAATRIPLDDYPRPVQAAVANLADRLDLDPGQVQVLEMQPVEWPDACLGAARPREVCAQVVTPGYTVILSAEGGQYEYHTDLATALRLVP